MCGNGLKTYFKAVNERYEMAEAVHNVKLLIDKEASDLEGSFRLWKDCNHDCSFENLRL